MTQELSLVILAAGMGSRYGGLKQIDEFGPNGESLLEYAVYDALKAGFDHMVFVIREEFEEAFTQKFSQMLEACPKFTLVHQVFDPEFDYAETVKREKPRGTLHATLTPQYVVDGPFAVISADDWYGTNGYTLMAEKLRMMTSSQSYLLGFVLGNTLSDHGNVNRGVCSLNDGVLEHVNERYKIEKQNGKILDKDANEFTGEEVVSMNFRGFHQDFFKQANPLFVDFVVKNSQGAIAEMVIPDAVDALIHDKTLTCEVINSPDGWQGVTNPEDKPRVQAAFDQMIKEGVYPSHLWE